MRCHGLFLKPQKAPHPLCSSLFPHQPCVRRSWGMDLGKPCHLHRNGTWGSSSNLHGNGATPAQLRPAGEDGQTASSSHGSTWNCRDGRTDGWMSHLWEAHCYTAASLLSMEKVSLWLIYKTATWHMHKDYAMADHSEGIYLHEWGGEGYSGEAPRSWPVSPCEWRLMCCEMSAHMYHARTVYLSLYSPLLPSALFSWTNTALTDDQLQGIRSPSPQNVREICGKQSA